MMPKLRRCRKGPPHLVTSFLLFQLRVFFFICFDCFLFLSLFFCTGAFPQLFCGSSPHRLKDKELKGSRGRGWRAALVDVGGLYFEGALQRSDSLRAPVQMSADVSPRAALTPTAGYDFSAL